MGDMHEGGKVLPFRVSEQTLHLRGMAEKCLLICSGRGCRYMRGIRGLCGAVGWRSEDMEGMGMWLDRRPFENGGLNV